jgi:hypothetical protein
MVEMGTLKRNTQKIGTAVPYFPKVPFEASHLAFGNANIVSYFRRIGDFFSCRLSNETFFIFISK